MKRIYDDREPKPVIEEEEDADGEDDEEWKAVKLSSIPNFEDSNVNLELSAVHVPINVWQVCHSVCLSVCFVNYY